MMTPGHAEGQRLACLDAAATYGNSESSAAPEKRGKSHLKMIVTTREIDVFKHKVLQKEYNVTLV